METRSKVSGGSEPLKKAMGGGGGGVERQSGHQKITIFLHAKHRETNTKLGLR